MRNSLGRLRGLAILRGALLVALVASTPDLARAAERRADEVTVASALVRARRTEDGLAWTARFILPVDGRREGLVRFAAPLPADERFEPSRGITPLVEDGAIVGVRFTEEAIADDGRSVSVVFLQPAGGGATRLGIPVAAGSTVEIVDLVLEKGARIEVKPSGALERRVGYAKATGVSEAARAEARRLTGHVDRVSSAALYVRGDDLRHVTVTGTVVSAKERAHAGRAGIVAAFAGLVLVLVLALGRLRRRSSEERADAVLAAEIDGLDERAT